MVKHYGRLSSVIPLVYFKAGDGCLAYNLSPSLCSVKFPRSDARPTAQPVYACVLWLKGIGRFSRSLELGICWPQSTLKEY